MNRKLFLAVLLCLGTASFAQKKVAPPSLPTISLPEAVAQYRFSDAELILNQQIADMRKRNVDVTEKEAQLRAVHRAKTRMQTTECITFVDSIICNKADMTKYIYLSDECGQVDTYAHHFKQTDPSHSTIYLSQFADKLIFSRPDAQGHRMLYTTLRIGNEWTDPEPLNEMGLSEHGDLEQDYPFMFNDGTTLYYAAKGEESIGGYDIFMTRFDADENRFLAPENIGMPFNSLANDYLYCVDEYHNIGYFVTDRNAPADHVCVYTFIPNNSRRIYNAQELEEERLAGLARINCIADTWTDKNAVQKAQATVATLKASPANTHPQETFTLVINDELTLTSLSGISNPEVQKMVKFWQESQSDLTKSEQKLQALRDQYAASTPQNKKSMASEILEEEHHVQKLNQSIQQQVKEIRRKYKSK